MTSDVSQRTNDVRMMTPQRPSHPALFLFISVVLVQAPRSRRCAHAVPTAAGGRALVGVPHGESAGQRACASPRSAVRLHEPAGTPWLTRLERRGLERVWTVHVHLELQASV